WSCGKGGWRRQRVMTSRTLVLRSLRYHWRSHFGVLLGATTAAAILVGALAVGDSVRYSLRGLALKRLGGIHLVLDGRERFFRAALAGELSADLHAPVAAATMLGATASARGGEVHAGRVQVVGGTDGIWALAEGPPPPLQQHGAGLNDPLAQRRA